MILLTRLPAIDGGKKWMVQVGDKTIKFGASGYEDFTMHKDEARKRLYLQRHSRSGRENWHKSGIETAGFWSRWLLWNKTSISSSMADIRRRFGVGIRRS